MGYAKHGHPEYDAKTAAGCLADGEPTFLLRAQDVYAVEAIEHWIGEVEAGIDGPHPDNPVLRAARKVVDKMAEWQKAHPSKVKFPD